MEDTAVVTHHIMNTSEPIVPKNEFDDSGFECSGGINGSGVGLHHPIQESTGHHESTHAASSFGHYQHSVTSALNYHTTHYNQLNRSHLNLTGLNGYPNHHMQNDIHHLPQHHHQRESVTPTESYEQHHSNYGHHMTHQMLNGPFHSHHHNDQQVTGLWNGPHGIQFSHHQSNSLPKNFQLPQDAQLPTGMINEQKPVKIESCKYFLSELMLHMANDLLLTIIRCEGML